MLGLLILLLPPAEVMLTLYLGKAWGWWAVLGGFALSFAAGLLLIRLRGVAFFKQAKAAMQRQEMPAEALVGGIAWYVAGVLLLIPGFLTDLLAALVLLPPVRRRVLDRFRRQAEERLKAMQAMYGAGVQWPPQAGPMDADVLEGEAHEINEQAPRVQQDHADPKP